MVGPRIVRRANGGLLCGYMTQTSLGVADFSPTLAASEDGRQWEILGAVWPESKGESLFMNLSRDHSGDLFLFGARTSVEIAGEPFWSPATGGLKANRLVWARSRDDGRTWSTPREIPVSLEGAAEVGGPLCILDTGAWLGCYAPSFTFDPDERVDRAQVIVVSSTDQGGTWSSSPAIRLRPDTSASAESWVVQARSGEVLASCWHIGTQRSGDLPHAVAVSLDRGVTWSRTGTTGTVGQAASLTPLEDGRVAMLFNRRHGEPGVWLALLHVVGNRVRVDGARRIWEPAVSTLGGTSGAHEDWTDFAFGEPAAVQLADGDLLAVIWAQQPDGAGIVTVRIRPD
jgi:hypothetical protein